MLMELVSFLVIPFLKSTREKFPREANSSTTAGCPKSPMAPGSVGKKGGPHTFGGQKWAETINKYPLLYYLN